MVIYRYVYRYVVDVLKVSFIPHYDDSICTFGCD